MKKSWPCPGSHSLVHGQLLYLSLYEHAGGLAEALHLFDADKLGAEDFPGGFCVSVCPCQYPAHVHALFAESTDFGGGHEASCWLHDPRAPRVDAPLYDEKEGRV